eukprot:28773-Alexandrium_andersonii.AAC.1
MVSSLGALAALPPPEEDRGGLPVRGDIVREEPEPVLLPREDVVGEEDDEGAHALAVRNHVQDDRSNGLPASGGALAHCGQLAPRAQGPRRAGELTPCLLYTSPSPRD